MSKQRAKSVLSPTRELIPLNGFMKVCERFVVRGSVVNY